MKKETYNGWTNYATWRVMLENFDGVDFVRDDVWGDTVGDFAEQLQGDVETRINDYDDPKPDSVAQSYAHAFISDCNWYEMAESINETYELGLKAYD